MSGGAFLSGAFQEDAFYLASVEEGLRDPGTKGKPWLYEVPQQEFPAEVAAKVATERKRAAVEKRRATMAAKRAARAAAIDDEDEEMIWLLVA